MLLTLPSFEFSLHAAYYVFFRYSFFYLQLAARAAALLRTRPPPPPGFGSVSIPKRHKTGELQCFPGRTKFFWPCNGTRSRQPSRPGEGRGKTCESRDLAGGSQDLGRGPTTGGMWNLGRAALAKALRRAGTEASAKACRHQPHTVADTLRGRDWVYSGQHQGWISWWKTIGAIDKWLAPGQSWPWQGFGTRSCRVRRQILQQWQSSFVLPQGVSGKCSLERQSLQRKSTSFPKPLSVLSIDIQRDVSWLEMTTGTSGCAGSGDGGDEASSILRVRRANLSSVHQQVSLRFGTQVDEKITQTHIDVVWTIRANTFFSMRVFRNWFRTNTFTCTNMCKNVQHDLCLTDHHLPCFCVKPFEAVPFKAGSWHLLRAIGNSPSFG